MQRVNGKEMSCVRGSAGEPVCIRVNVLIAHSNELVSAGVESMLKAEPGFEVTCCGVDGVLAKPSAEQVRSASVVLADCATGLELAADASQRCRVLIFTDDESEASIRRAFQLGVCSYLLLTSTREVVTGALRSVHAGGTAFDPVVSARMIASLSAPVLTFREVEVLRLVMAGLSDKTIARQLRRSVATVKCHVKTLLVKLDAGSRTEAAAIARRRGLISPATLGLDVYPAEPLRRACVSRAMIRATKVAGKSWPITDSRLDRVRASG